MKKYFATFLSAYKKNYSSQNILISLIEGWRKNLDNFVVGAVLTDLSKAILTDLSKAFDYIFHQTTSFIDYFLSLITKPSAYNFSDEALSYTYS